MSKAISAEKKSLDLSAILSTALQIPGVKVSRDTFLREQFKKLNQDEIEEIVDKGPISAGRTRAELKRKASRIIKECTALSTSASFLAGIPGGFAMAATIPADMLQFYGVALRMAQELLYLYGEEDIWCESVPDGDKVTNQFILYFGVMLGATGAAQAVRVMSAKLAKQLLSTLPKKALTKTFYYPVIKTILRYFGVSITKSSFAKGVSKAVPVVGGIVSGGITLASMLPMGNRLVNTLDKAHFAYTEEDFEEDMIIISEIITNEEARTDEPHVYSNNESSKADILNHIKEVKQMFDDGILSEEEYQAVKAKFLSEL